MKTLFSFIIMAASVALFMVYTSEHYQHVKNLRVQTAEYDSALTQSKLLLDQRTDLQTKYDSIVQDNLDKLKKLAPDSIDNVRLIIDIDDIAQQKGMTIRNIKISSGASAKQGALGPDNNPFGSILLSFSVTAPYDTFKDYLNSLETSLRIVDITSLSFSATDKGDVYDYGVTLRTYWLRQ